MDIICMLLFLIGTNLSYIYTKVIQNEKSFTPSKISFSENNELEPIFASAQEVPNYIYKSKTPSMEDVTRMKNKEPVVTVEAVSCPHEQIPSDLLEEPHIVPVEIPPAPVLPPLVLTEPPIEVIEDLLVEECPKKSHFVNPPQTIKLRSGSYDIGEEIVQSPAEISIEDINESPVLKNVPSPPELPPIISITEGEDCNNVLRESISPPPEPNQVYELRSGSYDDGEDITLSSSESSIEDVNETPVLPNIPTPPELPALVSFSEKEDCDNIVD